MNEAPHFRWVSESVRQYRFMGVHVIETLWINTCPFPCDLLFYAVLDDRPPLFPGARLHGWARGVYGQCHAAPWIDSQSHPL